MPAKTERYRFMRWEIEAVDGVARTLPGGFADVTRGGGLKHERVVFLGPGGKPRTEVHLKRGHVHKLEQVVASLAKAAHDRVGRFERCRRVPGGVVLLEFEHRRCRPFAHRLAHRRQGQVAFSQSDVPHLA